MVNCRRDKYWPLKMRENGDDCCGPSSLYFQPVDVQWETYSY